MKHLSKRNRMIAIVTAIVLIAATLGVSLSLTMCDYGEPDLPAGITESPYGNYDYSKKPYFSLGIHQGVTIYNGDAYFMDALSQLMSISLVNLENNRKDHVREEEDEYIGQTAKNLCPAADHDHGTFTMKCYDCPGWICGTMMFLLDTYESAGSYPIIYYAGWTDPAGQGSFEGNAWDRPSTYSIYRYDSGNNTRKVLVETEYYPIQMMSYGENLYVVTQSALNEFQVNLIDKENKTMTELPIGDGQINLLSADDEFIYLNDYEGNIYRASSDLQSHELIHTVEVLVFNLNDYTHGIFIDGGYLYFRGDYDTLPFQATELAVFEPKRYNIYRLPLNDLDGERELVAEGVFEDDDLGVAGGKFYYAPMKYGEADDRPGFYYNFTSGMLKCVDLTTLETTDVLTDCGFELEGGSGKLVGETFVIAHIRPYKDMGYDFTNSDASSYIALYDFTTGDLYALIKTGGAP